MFPRLLHVGHLEVVDRELQLVGEAYIAVSRHTARLQVAGPHDVINRIHVLQERGDALQAIRQLGGNRIQIDASALLEVCKLRDLKPVKHHLPADAPGAQRGRFPIVFFELNVVLAQINSHCAQRLQIQILHVLRRRLQNDLQLHVLIQAIGILAVTPICRPPRRLHVCDFVWFGSKHAQKSLRRHCAGANFDVVWLLQDASTLGPEGLEAKDEFLKRWRLDFGWIHQLS